MVQMLSDKQMKLLSFQYSNYDGVIADGAIRTGKTSILMIGFVDWAMRTFNNRVFGICGRTIGSVIKNIVDPYLALSYSNAKYKLIFKRQESKLIVSDGNITNTFYMYCGKDNSSYTLIQGITFAGVLIDEVTLLVKSFVEQAIARCSVEGSKFWFSCNPTTPEHWFYKEWVLKCREKNIYYIHFKLRDNPSLSEYMLQRYEKMYTGVFYSRYILGEWVQAEGLVYSLFDKSSMLVDIDAYKEEWGNKFKYADFYVSIDYGITNPFAALLWGIIDDKAYCIDEYYYKSDPANNLPVRTDEEHYNAIVQQFGVYDINSIIIDPSANSFKATIRKHGDYQVNNANNDVINGISCTLSMFKDGKLFIGNTCKNLIRELGLYSWETKAGGRDSVIKENDHACDSMRYFCNTIFKKYIEEI